MLIVGCFSDFALGGRHPIHCLLAKLRLMNDAIKNFSDFQLRSQDNFLKRHNLAIDSDAYLKPLLTHTVEQINFKNNVFGERRK